MFYTLNIVLMVFGAINAIIAEQQLRMFLKLRAGKTIAKNSWLKQHIGMMTGTYIATFTAFIVVNYKAS
jgi:cytochrome b561